jgi:hypothetical protein
MFRSMSHGDIRFTNDKALYGLDSKSIDVLKSKHIFKESIPKKFSHDTNFKLARRGHGDPLGKYP